MATVYVPPLTAQEKSIAWVEMMARDYRCRVVVALDDCHGVSFRYESNYGTIEEAQDDEA